MAVGIDLGTTFSVVSVCRKGKVEVLANDDGHRITPSVVAFLDSVTYVGEAAEDVEVPASSRVFGKSPPTPVLTMYIEQNLNPQK